MRILQVCPSLNRPCGVGNFARNVESALREAGVSITTSEQYTHASMHDLVLVQHEFALYSTEGLKSWLRTQPGSKALFAHSPGADAFAEEVGGFVTLSGGMIDAPRSTLVLPHPGWSAPNLLDRTTLKDEFGWSGRRCVVGTNGFISPSRQYDAVLWRLLDFAVEQDALIYVHCPLHGSHDSRPGYRDQELRLLEMARKYPEHLELNMRFVDQESLDRRLQACDLLWCWTATPSKPYGSGTCSDQYGSGTRLVVVQKQQHWQVLGLPNVVAAPDNIDAFVDVLKSEMLQGNFARHDPAPLSWKTFAERLIAFLADLRPSVNVPHPNGKPVAVRAVSLANGHGPPLSGVRLTQENAASRAAAFIDSIPDYPGGFAGRGIVICAGGLRLNTCAWVLIRSLRRLGCELPIEVWCYEHDRDDAWAELARSWGAVVRTVPGGDGFSHPHWAAWRLKPQAILGSKFQEVLLLDAYVAPIRDPSALFNADDYRATGATFWSDARRAMKISYDWQLFGAPPCDESEQESGQILIDKQRCWKPINLCHWYSEHAEFFYNHVNGDKDTYRVAWHRLGAPYARPPVGAKVLPRVFIQHDLAGNPLFLHRHQDDWSLGGNGHSTGPVDDAACLGFVDELRAQWKLLACLAPRGTLADLQLAESLRGAVFECTWPGRGQWVLTLGRSGTIVRGSTRDMAKWWVETGRLVLGSAKRVVKFVLGSSSDRACGDPLESGPSAEGGVVSELAHLAAPACGRAVWVGATRAETSGETACGRTVWLGSARTETAGKLMVSSEAACGRTGWLGFAGTESSGATAACGRTGWQGGGTQGETIALRLAPR